MPNKVEKIRAERDNLYGPHTDAHRRCGMIWTALLEQHYQINLPHPIPGSVVELMMAGNKMNRIAVAPDHADSYDDCEIFLELSKEARQVEKS